MGRCEKCGTPIVEAKCLCIDMHQVDDGRSLSGNEPA
jgi:hypothetical protein